MMSGGRPTQAQPKTEEDKRREEQRQWNAYISAELYDKTAQFKREWWYRVDAPEDMDDELGGPAKLMSVDQKLVFEAGVYKYTKNKKDEPTEDFNIRVDENGQVYPVPRKFSKRSILATMDFLGVQGATEISVKMEAGLDTPEWIIQRQKRQLWQMINHAKEKDLVLNVEDAKGVIDQLPPKEQDKIYKAVESLKINREQVNMMIGAAHIGKFDSMAEEFNQAGGLDVRTKSLPLDQKKDDVLNQAGSPRTLDSIEKVVENLEKRLAHAKVVVSDLKEGMNAQKKLLNNPGKVREVAASKHNGKYKDKYKDDAAVIDDMEKRHDESKQNKEELLTALDREIFDIDDRQLIFREELTQLKQGLERKLNDLDRRLGQQQPPLSPDQQKQTQKEKDECVKEITKADEMLKKLDAVQAAVGIERPQGGGIRRKDKGLAKAVNKVQGKHRGMGAEIEEARDRVQVRAEATRNRH
ncbi:MAG: hypothetical protein KIT56_04570 [Gammaproteobacteria bacterium]|nr:hypothetical protein [Gammaproteobacteria bacterium]MCW5583152.1 hypothetical protein [Gammaproteobacteria bacterium]